MSSSARRISATDLRLGALALGLGAVLLGWRLGWAGFSWDEYVTLMFTRAGWGQLGGDLWDADTHRPFYYALQKAWNAMAGDSPAAIRSLSALVMLASVPVVMALTRQLRAAPAAGFAALLFVSSAMFLHQGRDARMYCLQTLFLMLAVLLALRLACRLRAGPDRPLWPLWTGIALTLTLAFYAHSLSLLAAGLLGLWMLVAIGLGYLPRRGLMALAGAIGLYALLIAPGLYTLLFHTRGAIGADFWIPTLSPGYVYTVFSTTFPYPTLFKPLVPVAILWGLWSLRTRPEAALLIGLLVIGLPLLIGLISLAKPILMYRAIAWSSLLAVVPMAVGLAALAGPWRWGGLALLLLAQALALPQHYPARPEHPDFSAFQTVSETYQPGRDVLVLEYQGLEPALRWHVPALFTGTAYAFKYGTWNTEILEQAYHATRLDSAEASRIRPADGRLFVLSSAEDPQNPPAGYPEVHSALQAQLQGLTLQQDLQTAPGYRLQVYAP